MIVDGVELFSIPGFEFLFSTKDGRCYSRRGNKYLRKVITSTGKVVYNLTICNRSYFLEASKLVAAALLPIPDGFNLPRDYKLLQVGFKDNNSNNIDVNNLYWVTKLNKDFLLSEAAGSKRLRLVPGVVGLMVNEDGVCYSMFSDTILKPKIKNTMVLIKHKSDSKEKVYLLKELVARAFVHSYPEGMTADDIPDMRVYHKDGNPLNFHYKNLRWGTSYTINFPELLEQFKDEDTRLTVIPSLGSYAINKKGEVYNLSTGCKRSISTNENGYRVLVTVHRGENRTIPHHRLVGEVFVPPKEGFTIQECLDSLVINHKNLDKTDNRPDNLEWVTPSENNCHFFENGARQDIDRFKVNNILTNKEKVYRSLSNFCKTENVSYKLVSLAREHGLLGDVIFNNFSLKVINSNDPHLNLDVISTSPEKYFCFYDGKVTTLICTKRSFDLMFEKMGRIFSHFCNGNQGPTNFRDWSCRPFHR